MKRYRVETKSGNFLGVIDGKRAFKTFWTERQKYNTYTKLEDVVPVEVKQSKKAEHIIYDNYDVYNDEALQAEKENFIENGWKAEDITEDMLESAVNDSNSIWFEDERSQLEQLSEGTLIAIADLGRWNGRFSGYKEVKSLGDAMYSSCDYEKVYVDGNGDLRKDESHHDGSNSILYRYWKDTVTERQKNNLMDKIYNGKCTGRDITRYTRKAGLSIARLYGWKVRA